MFDWFTPDTLLLLSLLAAYCVPMLVAGCDCCATCDICADDFTRANGTDIDTGSSCGWTETAGSWSISSNTLVTSSTSAIAKCNSAHPGSISSAVVTVDVQGASGDKPRVLIDFDGTNYHYVEVTVGTSGCITLGKHSGGSDTELKHVAFSLAAATPQTLVVYFDGVTTNRFKVVAGATTLCANHVTPVGGTYVGLGTGGTAASVVFDNFDFDKHYQASGASSCPTSGACTDDCAIGSDTFPGSALSCAWSVTAGSASISSNALALTASNTTVRYLDANPDTRAHSGSVSFKGANNNDVVKVYLPGSNTITITIGASKTMTLGSESVTVSTTAGTFYGLTFCIGLNADGTTVVYAAFVDNSGLKCVSIGGSLTGTGYVELGCGSITSQVTFDSFTLARAKDSVDSSCDACGHCGSCCADYTTVYQVFTPAKLRGTVVLSGWTARACDTTGICAASNGTWVSTNTDTAGRTGVSSCTGIQASGGAASLQWINDATGFMQMFDMPLTSATHTAGPCAMSGDPQPRHEVGVEITSNGIACGRSFFFKSAPLSENADNPGCYDVTGTYVMTYACEAHTVGFNLPCDMGTMTLIVEEI